MNANELIIFSLAIALRLFAGTAALFTVIKPIINQRKIVPPELLPYNNMLIFSVSCFIITCYGTTLFQLCRAGWIPGCSTENILDAVALFNALGLFAAWYVMTLMIRFQPKQPQDLTKKKRK